MNFVRVPTLPYEQRVGSEKVTYNFSTHTNTNVGTRTTTQNENHIINDNYNSLPDGADLIIMPHEIRTELNLSDHWLHREPELLTLDSTLRSSVSVDRISKFSILPPDLRKIFNKAGDYLRWFHISSNKIDTDKFKEYLSQPILESRWFDGMLDSVKVRDTALKEIAVYLNTLQINTSDLYYPIYQLFQDIIRLHNIENDEGLEDSNLVNTWRTYEKFIHKESRKHLPVPVFNYIKPTMSTRFILHVLLSMG